jgi:AraC-like DNA-binding protein
MIYSGENRITKLINAEALCWKTGTFDVLPRKVCALAFRVEGTADMTCAEKHFYIGAGDVLYMPQGLGYQVDYSDTQMYCFHFVTEFDDPEPEVYKLPDPGKFHRLMLRAVELWSKKEPGYEQFCMGMLYQALGLLCQSHQAVQLPEHFKKAVSYIHQNFQQELSVNTLCRMACISPTSFRQMFQTYYKTTPTGYIQKLRLECGRNLIASGISVEQAAISCGIKDPKYFARLVRREYDCTPRQLKIYGK